MTGEALLASWTDTSTRQAITDFVVSVTDDQGDTFVPEPERVAVSDVTGLLYKSKIEFFDDGPEKPVRIWSRLGRRPILACGNSNGDVQMLRFARTEDRASLRLLLLHDDAEREFDYTEGAEDALAAAGERDWTVISIRRDWARVFPDA